MEEAKVVEMVGSTEEVVKVEWKVEGAREEEEWVEEAKVVEMAGSMEEVAMVEWKVEGAKEEVE